MLCLLKKDSDHPMAAKKFALWDVAYYILHYILQPHRTVEQILVTQ